MEWLIIHAASSLDSFTNSEEYPLQQSGMPNLRGCDELNNIVISIPQVLFNVLSNWARHTMKSIIAHGFDRTLITVWQLIDCGWWTTSRWEAKMSKTLAGRLCLEVVGTLRLNAISKSSITEHHSSVHHRKPQSNAQSGHSNRKQMKASNF